MSTARLLAFAALLAPLAISYGCGGGSGATGTTGTNAAGSSSVASSGTGGNGGATSGTGGATSGTGGAATGGADAGSDAAAPSDPCGFAHDTTVDVGTADELTAALAAAAPGTLIRLAPGTYSGHFVATAQGAAQKPIILCGPRAAILDGGGTKTGYAFHLQASSWILSGFSVTNAQKGIVLDGASQNLLIGLAVYDIGDEGVHFRKFSTNNTLQGSEIHDTGKLDPGYGEGVYIGSAKSNWATITGDASTPDKSDGNHVIGNLLGPNTGAEPIDIKEGTTGGEIRGNTIDGTGISGQNSATSWVNVKGNGYTIRDNTGSHSPQDGFSNHVVLAGWGNDNVFHGNVANVDGPGYGFYIATNSTGNVVGCDNTATGAGQGLSNVACTP